MIEWLINYRKSIITYSLSAFAIVFSVYSIWSKVRPQPEKDYLAANVYFNKWVNGDKNDQELFQKLEKMIAKHPELHAKYDALIAEKCLLWNEAKHARNYLSSALKRIESDASYYPQFAKTTLLIAEGDLKQALEDAHDLYDEMTGDESLFTSVTSRWEGFLHAFNLVRIGMLEKEVGTSKGEVDAWSELISLKDKDPEAFSMVQYHFRKNNLTLFDYIQYRQSQINLMNDK